MRNTDTIINHIYSNAKPFKCVLSNGVAKNFQTHQLAWTYGENWKLLKKGNSYRIEGEKWER